MTTKPFNLPGEMTIKHLDSYFQIALMRNWHTSAGLARPAALSGDAANAREVIRSSLRSGKTRMRTYPFSLKQAATTKL